MPLFEVAIIEKPTKKDAENGVLEELILGPQVVVAADKQAAALDVIMEATREDAFIKPIDTSRIEVLVRPFV